MLNNQDILRAVFGVLQGQDTQEKKKQKKPHSPYQEGRAPLSVFSHCLTISVSNRLIICDHTDQVY